MNATYLRIDLLRQLRDVANIVFVVALPVFMYVLFGSTFGAGGELAGRGDVRFAVMTAMAAYGAAVATTAISGTAAVELMQGWGRQLGLTPLRPAGFVATKVVVALVVAAAAVLAVGTAGVLTGASAPPGVWMASAVITWVGSAMFALYGLAVAQWFRSESAVGIGSASLVLLAFFGNLFVPLSGAILHVARWTPMYGFAALVRYPQLQGAQLVGDERDQLWALLANVVGWTLVLAGICLAAVRRGGRRQ